MIEIYIGVYVCVYVCVCHKAVYFPLSSAIWMSDQQYWLGKGLLQCSIVSLTMGLHVTDA